MNQGYGHLLSSQVRQRMPLMARRLLIFFGLCPFKWVNNSKNSENTLMTLENLLSPY